jgi:uncharacterized membrane protein required for colicin V production
MLRRVRRDASATAIRTITPMGDSAAGLVGIDAFVILATLGVAARGWWKGFVWQAVRTGGALVALFVAARVEGPAGRLVARLVPSVAGDAADVWGWAVAAVLVFAAAAVVAHVLRDAVRTAGLTAPDRVLGAVLGAALGFALCSFGATLWASTREPAEVRRAFDGSVTAEWMAKTVRASTPLFPPGVRRRWGPVLGSLD